MGKLSYNGNRFTYVNKWDAENASYTGILLATKVNQKNGQDYKLLDIIDIDFDRTWFAPTQSYITNAEEFFDAIETLDKTTEFSYINERIDDIVAAYVTRSEFLDTISQYQGALKYGDHIAVVDDDILIAYDVISNSQLYEFSTAYVSYDYFHDTTYSKNETEELIDDKIRELIGGANEAFDTMQEISDWIMQQSSFVEVNYGDIDLSSDNKYYIYNQDTGNYDLVDKEYIESHPNEQYYEIESLIDKIKRIDEKVGHVSFDAETGYTYTGILKEINDLHSEDEFLSSRITMLSLNVERAVSDSEYALNASLEAKQLAAEANDAASEAKEIAESTIEKSDLAYNMAYSSYMAVGIPSHEAFYREINDNDIANMNDGDWAYEYAENIGYYPSIYYAEELQFKQYYVLEPSVEATGLHKVAEDAFNIANTSLFNLSIDNTNAIQSYVYLDITPMEYDNDPHRTISLTAAQAQYSIDEMKIFNDGLLTACQFNEILAYALSWEKLPSPSEI